MIFTPIPIFLALSAGASSTGSALRVRCVEARTASVFAGACHYGAEATTAGREALVAWHVESGSFAGVDLAGVDLAAAIAGEANLADPVAARRSVVYVSDRATPSQREAAEALLRLRLRDRLGRVLAVAAVPLATRFDGDRYLVDGGRLFRIEGALLADRACCRMPLAVWYEPISPISAPIVGSNSDFRFADERLGLVWDRHDENTGFAGTLTRADPRCE